MSASSSFHGFLDWPELLGRLAERAQSSRGAAVCASLALCDSPAEATARMALVTEMVSLLEVRESLPSLAFPDIEPHLAAVERGVPLGPEEFKQVVAFCEVGAAARRTFSDATDAVARPGLDDIAAALGTHDELATRARQTFDASGEIRDSASPDLLRLRRERDSLGAHVRQEAERLLHSEEFAPYLQDQFVTLRADRFVLPLRASFKSMGLGIVHDTSRTGETVFVEPTAVVGLNNRLKVAEIEIRRECRRILEELAALVATAADGLRADGDILTQLDVLAAQARLSRAYGGAPVEIVDEPLVDARTLRHPLLALRATVEKFAVTPNDVTLGQVAGRSEARVLVISGPNAGGKTVLLKAVGLAALLARAGMHVPADPGSRVGFFHRVLADIGDQQSVLGDLSTFSAHLENLATILTQAAAAPNESLLVLCDELMAGTHPEQGAALARATLEALADCHGLVIATTHYDSLKALTDGDARFRNAGMEYDLARLRPTFRLKDGLPGRSYALDIAARMGLPHAVLTRARGLLGGSAQGLEEVLRSLEAREQALGRASQALDDARSDLEQQAGDQRSAADQLGRRERELAASKRVAVDAAVREARDALAEIVREARRVRSGPALQAARQSLEQAAKTVTAGLPEPEALDVQKLRDALATRALGVKSGAAKSRYPQAKAAPKAEPRRDAETVLQSRANSVDLRGMRADEALREMERYLDQAVLGSTETVFVIHGHGTGALRQVVREYLATSPYVERFRAGGAGEGGDGVSVVSVKG